MPSPGHARLPSLTGLRFLLAFTVLLCHTALVFAGPVNSLTLLTFPVAAAAVSGFFVLSGFVLTWTHVPGDRARAFWRRRFWKIFPDHALTWAVAVAFFTPLPSLEAADAPPPYAAVLGLFLLQNWVPRGEVYAAFNTPAWSLSCEAFFYALFPVLIAAVRAVRAGLLRRLWAATAAIVLLLPLVAAHIPGPRPTSWIPISEYGLWFCYVLPPVRLPEFILGVITARLVQTGGWRQVPRTGILLAFLAACGALAVLPPTYVLGSTFAIPLTLVIVRLARADVHERSAWLARPAPSALGEASYALYVVHVPLLLVAAPLLPAEDALSPWAALPSAAAFMLTAQFLAWMLYRFYERPLNKAWARPRPRPAPSSSTADRSRP
ncbi:acyltransferase [Spirillospora sp. NPDC029432]|uniref:acyltransferase family protein n=1 Tax=Spirillospora sp. NPDC029432 TaxID=3154599 RepID=UPI00345567AD